MKRLITAADVVRAAQAHENIVIDANTIVTPQAKDEAHELGVELCCETSCASHTCPEAPTCHAPAAPQTSCTHEEHHSECHSAPAHTSDCAPALSVEEMEKFLRAALSAGVWTESELRALVEKIKKG